MLAVQLGSSSRTARLLLAACVVSSLVFGLIWATQHDAVAAAFCLAALAGAVQMGLVLRRRHRMEATAGVVAHGRTFASVLADSLFMSFGHYTVGARLRRGVVLIGPSSAAFVPVEGWTHLAWEAITTPFVARFRFVDLAIELSSSGDVDAVVHDAVVRHDGFFIDETWTYTHSQRWLSRPGVPGIVWIERPPPESITARWTAAQPPSEERYRWLRNRIMAVAAVIMAVFGIGGVVAWRLTGEVDYLVAGLVYGLLLAGSMIGGVVVARRRLFTDATP